jgi:cobyrinic acid a,c-diamide synthase
VVVAGVSSGVGKTTVATGLMAALAARGLRVASAKVGPDFIDPGYHAEATGRPGRNLDLWMSGADTVLALAGRAAEGADVLLIEGVMGLFDGARDGTATSTADVACLIDAPVLLVVDASALSGSVAALVHGYASFDPRVRVAGVVLNRVGSDTHEAMLRQALDRVGVPVVGALRRDAVAAWPRRHLGLVPAAEQRHGMRPFPRLADAVAAACDLDAVVALARSAPRTRVPCTVPPRYVGPARIAMPSGHAFGFVYADNIEALEHAGAEIVPFDPMEDGALPDRTDALYVPGGFPELFVDALAANTALLGDVRARVASGLVTWAECGGLLWLARALDGHRLAGALPTAGHMVGRLTVGYRVAGVRTSNPVAAAGGTLRGHEFHYSAVEPPGDALDISEGDRWRRAGFATASLFASYLHLHLGATPEVPERFVATARRLGASTRHADIHPTNLRGRHRSSPPVPPQRQPDTTP